MYHVYKVSLDESDSKVDYSSLDDPIWKTQFSNPLLPNVSSKVKIAYSPAWGRHWLAAEDIQPGISSVYSQCDEKSTFCTVFSIINLQEKY